MNKNMTIIPLCAMLMLGTLTGCGEAKNKYNDLNEIIKDLQVQDSYRVRNAEKNEYLVNELFFMDGKTTDGYVAKDNKVYPFRINGTGKVINGDAIENKSLYGTYDGILTNFDSVDATYFESGETSKNLKKRSIVGPLLEISGYDSSNYGRLEDTKISLIDDTLNLAFTYKEMGNDGPKLVTKNVLIDKIGEVNNEVVENFSKNGTLYVVDDDLLKVQSLFRTNQYIQKVYGDDENSEEHVMVATYYHPEYHFRLWGKDSIAQVPSLTFQQDGYITINQPGIPLNLVADKDGNPYPLIYTDTFKLTNYMGDYQHMESAPQLFLREKVDPQTQEKTGLAEGCFLNLVVTDITTAVPYPSDLTFMNNLYMLDKIDGYDAYSTLDQRLIQQTLYIFGLSIFFVEPVVEFQLIYNLQPNDANSTVYFRFVGENSVVDFSFEEFGSATFQPCEDILAEVDRQVAAFNK